MKALETLILILMVWPRLNLLDAGWRITNFKPFLTVRKAKNGEFCSY
jgi:hypothetical protein